MNAIIQHSVLIVSGTQKGAAYITELLSPREFAPMTTALSGGDARRLLLRRSYDLVVINTPLPAISDAIYNAIGTRFYELPITPEKIAMAVAKRNEE